MGNQSNGGRNSNRNNSGGSGRNNRGSNQGSNQRNNHGNNRNSQNSGRPRNTDNRSGKDNQKKVGINARNEKGKYSDDEIARARYVDSKAKFLVRDRIHNDNIDTRDKWIGISNLKVKDGWDDDGNYAPDITSFDAEIFKKTERPDYQEGMSDKEKHKMTYDVAERDINKQRNEERRTHQKEERPSYHVEVETKHNDDNTEYKVKDIKRKK